MCPKNPLRIAGETPKADFRTSWRRPLAVWAVKSVSIPLGPRFFCFHGTRKPESEKKHNSFTALRHYRWDVDDGSTSVTESEIGGVS